MDLDLNFQTIRYLGDLYNALAEKGMAISLGNDFKHYVDLRSVQKFRNPTYPMFDPSRSFANETNGFWIIANDRDGQTVHTQAVRFIDLASHDLSTHINSHPQIYLAHDMDRSQFADPKFEGARALHTITGTVCYHGDFWLTDTPAYRGAHYAPFLGRLAFAVAGVIWNPDFMFGIMDSVLANKGVSYRYGYCHCEPAAWFQDGLRFNKAVVWASREDIAWLRQQSLQNTVEAGAELRFSHDDPKQP